MSFSTQLWLCLMVVCLRASQSSGEDTPEPPQLAEEMCFKDGQCYQIWKFTEPLTKLEALTYCKNQSKTLATIATTSMEMTLAGQLGGSHDRAWVGLNLSPQPNWTWATGNGWMESNIPDSYIEDSNHLACLLINREGLRAVQCSYDAGYICEFSEEPPSYIECDKGVLTLGDKWFCVQTISLPWVKAARQCVRIGGNLLTLENTTVLAQAKTLIAEHNTHLWIAGTRVPLTWEEGDHVQINPYSLKWSNVTSNPNLDRALSNQEVKLCVVLSKQINGLSFRPCQDKLDQAICSTESKRVNPEPTAPSSTSDWSGEAISKVATSGEAIYDAALACNNSATCNSTISPFFNITSTNPTYNIGIDSGVKVTTEALHSDSHSENNFIVSGVSMEKYRAVMICAFILAALVLIGITLFIIIFVRSEGGFFKMIYRYGRRRRRTRHFHRYEAKFSSKSYKTLGNGTLGKQRSTKPGDEWERVTTENEVELISANAENEMDIIHNVPLDPRASIEEPLTIPRDSHVMTLQRAKSRESSNSLVSGEVATFSADRRSTGASSINIAPPVPPKLHSPDAACADSNLLTDAEPTNEQADLPPPPDYLLAGTSSPPVPPKPKLGSKRPARRHKKKPPTIPDTDIYAQIDKSGRRAPPVPAQKPTNYGAMDGIPPPITDIDILPDNSDSGVEMGVNSPPHSRIGVDSTTGHSHPQPASASEQLAYLDDVLAHMKNW